MAKSMMQELFELSIEELEERWNSEDPDIAGDEMITLTRWIHANNQMPKVGYGKLIGAHIAYKCGSPVDLLTTESAFNKSVIGVVSIGRVCYYVQLAFRKNSITNLWTVVESSIGESKKYPNWR